MVSLYPAEKSEPHPTQEAPEDLRAEGIKAICGKKGAQNTSSLVYAP